MTDLQDDIVERVAEAVWRPINDALVKQGESDTTWGRLEDFDKDLCRDVARAAIAAMPTQVRVKPLARHNGPSKLGWTLSPDMLIEVGQSVNAQGWDTCLEVTEIAMLEAEKILLSAIEPALSEEPSRIAMSEGEE